MQFSKKKAKTKNISTNALNVSLIIAVSLLALISCGTRTPTPTTVVNSNTPCPVNISRTPYQSNYTPILVYVLVEGTENYGDLITKSFEITKEVLQEKIQPEDRVFVSFMEYTDAESTRLFNGEVANAEIPQYTYSPPVVPTIPTNIPIPTTEGSFGNLVQETPIHETAVAYNLLLTQVADKSNCDQVFEEAHNKILFEEWNRTRQQAINQFVHDYSESIMTVNLNDLPEITRPVQALSQTSEIFAQFRDSGVYKKNYLIIFSNLGSIISKPPVEDGVNLKEFNVFVALQECDFLSDCSAKIERWGAYFKAAGASTISFMPKGDEKNILIQNIVR